MRVSFLCPSVSGLLACILGAHGAELIENGSLERTDPVSAKEAANWRGTYRYEKEGDNHFFRNVKDPKQAYADASSQLFEVREGADFTLKLKHRGAHGFCYILWRDKAGKNVAPTTQFGIPKADEWKENTFSGKVPEKAVSGYLLLRSFDSARGSDFDDVFLVSNAVNSNPKTAKNITVHLPDRSVFSDRTAQDELVNYLEKVISDKLEIDGHVIKNIRLVQERDLPEESYFLKSQGDTLTIGGSGRGLLYGVYTFLEDCLNVHWWSPTEEYVPTPLNVKLGAIDRQGKPVLIYRDAYRNEEVPDNGRFFARNRANACGAIPIAKEYGGDFVYGSPYHTHTLNLYISPEKYLKSNPDYFSLRDGKRLAGQFEGQPCLTHPEVKKIVQDKMLDYIKSNIVTAKTLNSQPPVLYDIGVNDNYNSCQCPRCLEAVKKYGESGVLLNFVNDIATAVDKEYPHVKIVTEAYQHTEEPPLGGVRPVENVIIKLCDIGSNTALGIMAPESKKFRETVKTWSNISKTLFIWDYALAYHSYELPVASELTYPELHRFYADNKVRGMFWEHEIADRADMFDLKLWLELKFMEDPYRDLNKLLDTFYPLYYGEAGKDIRTVREKLFAAAKKNRPNITFNALDKDYRYIDLDTLLECHKLFDQAEENAASSKVLLARVRRARLGIDILSGRQIRYYFDEWKKRGNTEATFPIDRKKIASRLRASWPEWVNRYKNPKRHLDEMQQEISKIEFSPLFYVPPQQFAKEDYIDFPVDMLRTYPDIALSTGTDRDAENGSALKFDVKMNPNYYAPPMHMGIYHPKTAKIMAKTDVKEIPTDGKYHWYLIGDTKFQDNCYIYLTRSWRVQAKLTGKGDMLDAKVYARLKFTGKAFKEKTPGDEGTIWIDRITVVKNKKK